MVSMDGGRGSLLMLAGYVLSMDKGSGRMLIVTAWQDAWMRVVADY